MQPSEVAAVAAICGDMSSLNAKYGNKQAASAENAAPVSVSQMLRALDEFMECVRYLNTRRSEGAVLELDSEAAVQDALYLMLRPWVVDLVPESPSDKVANRFTIKDFISGSTAIVVEAKYIRDRDHGKAISKEIHDDIETYRHNPSCRHLVFFIYDPDALIPDHGALARQVQVQRTYGGKPLDCYLVVKP